MDNPVENDISSPRDSVVAMPRGDRSPTLAPIRIIIMIIFLMPVVRLSLFM
jgi:hypothetical protein